MKRWLMKGLMMLQVVMVSAQNKSFEEIVTDYHKSKNFNGVVLVATNGKVDYYTAVGMADRNKGTLIQKESKFKIASVTKVFTAVMVMKLYEKGLIDIKETIGKYYSEYKGEARDKVTIHQLLTYSSGIEHQLEPLGMQPYQSLKTIDEFIATYCSGKLINKPGEKSVYSNTEYIILHKILEKVSGKQYHELLKDMIVTPLGMNNTNCVNFELNHWLIPNYTFDAETKTFHLDPTYYFENYFGSANLYATAEDLLLFSNGLFGNKLLSENSLKTMLTWYPELGYTAYGLWGSDGWGNFDEPFYYRTGGILGATANWIYTTKTQKTIIVLSNTDATNLYELSEKLYLASKKME